MHLAERNKEKIFYSLLRKSDPVTDENGYESGEEKLTYYSPVEEKVVLSDPGGNSDLNVFGILPQYQRTMISDRKLPIEKGTILWVESIPDWRGEEGKIKHDYVVLRVYHQRNFYVWLIQSVSVE